MQLAVVVGIRVDRHHVGRQPRDACLCLIAPVNGGLPVGQRRVAQQWLDAGDVDADKRLAFMDGLGVVVVHKLLTLYGAATERGVGAANRRCNFTKRTVPSASVSNVAITAKATGIATTPSVPSKKAMIAARPPICTLFVSRGVRVSRSAMRPRTITSVAT